MQLEVYPSEVEEDNSIVAGDDVSILNKTNKISFIEQT